MTSPESPCPTREQGEPCLTLEQYTAKPSRSPTVTLVVEPGYHILKESRKLTSWRGTNFTMTSEGANIIFKFAGSIDLGISRGKARLNGITFSNGNSLYTEINIGHLQEVTFQDCSFQGVGIYMYDIAKVTLSRCNILNYDYQAAIYIQYSTLISFVQSNFINNTGALYFLKKFGSNLASLVIIRCNFINNTSEFHGGGAAYVIGDYYTVTVSQSTFIHNTASSNQEEYTSRIRRDLGGAGTINFDGTCINCTISRSIFISNCAHYCGALNI